MGGPGKSGIPLGQCTLIARFILLPGFSAAMKFFLIKFICLGILLFPSLLMADTDGTKQIKTMTVVTEDSDRLFMDIPEGRLQKMAYSSHDACWVIGPSQLDLHGGRLSLVGFQLTYNSSDSKSDQDEVTLYVPMIFEGSDGNDLGYLEAKFHSNGYADIDIWREKISATALDHFTIRKSEHKDQCSS